MPNNQKVIVFSELLKIFKKINYFINKLEQLVRKKEAQILENRKNFYNKVKKEMPIFKKDFKEAFIMAVFMWCFFFLVAAIYALEIPIWAEALPPFDPEKIPNMKWCPALFTMDLSCMQPVVFNFQFTLEKIPLNTI